MTELKVLIIVYMALSTFGTLFGASMAAFYGQEYLIWKEAAIESYYTACNEAGGGQLVLSFGDDTQENTCYIQNQKKLLRLPRH